MFPPAAQSDLDEWRRTSAFDTDRFADMVDWEGLGWPDFNIYRPLIETAGNARAHVIATDLPQPGSGGPSFDALLGSRAGLRAADRRHRGGLGARYDRWSLRSDRRRRRRPYGLDANGARIG
jgi:hypothetical protein